MVHLLKKRGLGVNPTNGKGPTQAQRKTLPPLSLCGLVSIPRAEEGFHRKILYIVEYIKLRHAVVRKIAQGCVVCPSFGRSMHNQG